MDNKIGGQQTRGEEEIAAAAGGGGLLLLPPQLQELMIFDIPELSLHTAAGGGLQGLHSLRYLFLSSYLSSRRFPTSLEDLYLESVEGMETLAPLSNLTSLTRLDMYNCGDLRGEGLWPLLAQGHLTELTIFRTPKFFVGSEPTSMEQEILHRSSVLRDLRTDDVAGVLAAPICSLLSSSLTELFFQSNEAHMERFTKEQEEALHLLTSLQELNFVRCDKLPCLPAGLHRLTNLKRLQIWDCPAIRSLPKDGLPSSLQELEIRNCPAIRSLPKELLSSLSSLRVLDVSGSNEELRRQCRKLTGTIPIIKT